MIRQADMNDMNIDSVDLNLLKVLQALHEEGTAGRAAIRLGVTQSAVSAALGRLRTLYGDPLFERTGRGLRPTPKAEELRPLIAEALQKLRQSLALAQPGGASLAGRTVVLGLSDDHEMALGRQLIDRLQQAAPGLRLVLRQTHSGLAADMLMDRRIDLPGCRHGQLTHPGAPGAGHRPLRLRDGCGPGPGRALGVGRLPAPPAPADLI